MVTEKNISQIADLMEGRKKAVCEEINVCSILSYR